MLFGIWGEVIVNVEMRPEIRINWFKFIFYKFKCAHINQAVQRLIDTGLIGQQRLFMGKNKEQNVGLFINDEKGRPRIKMYVNNAGSPVIEFFDPNGKKIPIK